MRDYSSYHNANQTDKMISDGNTLFETTLNGFEGYDISINNVTKRAVIRSKFTSDGNEKFNIFAKIGDASFGDVVVFNNKNYIIVSDLDETSKVYAKGIMQLCNNTLTITTESTKTIVGHDSLNRPIYHEVPGTTLQYPCIVQSLTNYYSGTSQAINVPEGRILISISNTTDANIAVGKKFTIFNTDYRINALDRSKTLKDKGILDIIADKITD